MYSMLMKLGALQGTARDAYLEQLANMFFAVASSIDAGVVMHDFEGKIIFVNPAALHILGLSEEQILGTTPLDPIWALLDESGTPLPQENFPALQVLATRNVYYRPCLGIRTPSGIQWARVNGVPMFAEQGFNAIITLVDITSLVESHNARTSSDEMWNSIYTSAPIGICMTDGEGRFIRVNKTYCEFYGYSEAELLGRNFTMIVPPDAREKLLQTHHDFMREGYESRGEWMVQTKTGEIRYVLADACRITGQDGQYRKVTFIIDISERKFLEEEMQVKNRLLQEASIRDGLTGVYNRRFLNERLPVMVSEMNRYKTTASLLMIDIDHFKQINDSLGHQAGDGVLLEVALQIKTGLRDTDVIMRYGGEEFVVLLPHTDLYAAQQLAERLRQNIQQNMPAYGVPATVSIGIAQLHSGESQHDWLKRADSALYLAKQQGRNRCMACSG